MAYPLTATAQAPPGKLPPLVPLLRRPPHPPCAGRRRNIAGHCKVVAKVVASRQLVIAQRCSTALASRTIAALALRLATGYSEISAFWRGILHGSRASVDSAGIGFDKLTCAGGAARLDRCVSRLCDAADDGGDSAAVEGGR